MSTYRPTKLLIPYCKGLCRMYPIVYRLFVIIHDLVYLCRVIQQTVPPFRDTILLADSVFIGKYSEFCSEKLKTCSLNIYFVQFWTKGQTPMTIVITAKTIVLLFDQMLRYCFKIDIKIFKITI